MTLGDVNLNAVNVFQPMGCSPIPTDICPAELNDYSVDEFNTPEQSTIYDTGNPSTLDYNDLPCNVADLYDWTNDDIDDICTLVDTGAMVTCTGAKHIIQHTKNTPS